MPRELIFYGCLKTPKSFLYSQKDMKKKSNLTPFPWIIKIDQFVQKLWGFEINIRINLWPFFTHVMCPLLFYPWIPLKNTKKMWPFNKNKYSIHRPKLYLILSKKIRFIINTKWRNIENKHIKFNGNSTENPEMKSNKNMVKYKYEIQKRGTKRGE